MILSPGWNTELLAFVFLTNILSALVLLLDSPLGAVYCQTRRNLNVNKKNLFKRENCNIIKCVWCQSERFSLCGNRKLFWEENGGGGDGWWECFLWGHQVMGRTHRDSSSFHSGFSSQLHLILGVRGKPERSLVKSDVFFWWSSCPFVWGKKGFFSLFFCKHLTWKGVELWAISLSCEVEQRRGVESAGRRALSPPSWQGPWLPGRGHLISPSF